MEDRFIQNIENRTEKINRVSLTGIITNLVLAAVKIGLGLTSGSIAIVSDAVNNITDSASSVITIIGTRLAAKAPDREHPFGHGRTEYLTSLVIGSIVMVTGIHMLISSLRSLGTKPEYNYSFITVAIMLLTVIAKVILGIYTENSGKTLGSKALIGSGKDAKNDALITSATLVSALIYMLFGYSTDAFAGTVIALFIVKAGYEILGETIKVILGERADADLAKAIYEMVDEEEMILGSHDLILNTYGPSTIIGTINVDIDHDKTVGEIYPIFHHLQLKIYEKLKIFLVIGVYAIDEHSARAKEVRDFLKEFEKEEPYVLGFHGVVIDEERTELYCDILLDFAADKKRIKEKLEEVLLLRFPDYDPHVTIDLEFA